MNLIQILQNTTPDQIDKEIDFKGAENFTKNNNMLHDINCKPGVEHYKLLSYISLQYENELLVEIGSWIGAGVLGLAFNSKNYVITYDISPYLELV